MQLVNKLAIDEHVSELCVSYSVKNTIPKHVANLLARS